jgi:putative Mg2+ transporter-C (MgtC) family protein
MQQLGALNESFGQSWPQVGDLALAFLLSSMIGLERELRQRSAGLRTHALVGLGAALFMLVSKYGFSDIVGAHVSFDPSRVAAQIVSGIGFIGGGLIFVRRDTGVSGLTTAAAIWLTAAVGMAAGAGLPLLAVLVTAAHFVVAYGFTALVTRIPGSKYSPSRLVMTYRDGEGVLRRALAVCTERGYAVQQLSTHRDEELEFPHRDVAVQLLVKGAGPMTELAAALSEVDGMVTVTADEVTLTSD